MGGPAPERAAHAAQHLVGLNFVPSGQRAKRGLNSCPEDNESRGKKGRVQGRGRGGWYSLVRVAAGGESWQGSAKCSGRK